MKVLIIEDHIISSKLMHIILENAGCVTDIAPDGTEALKLFFANKYDLILADIGLPDISGITVIRLIREYSKYKTHCPIIIALTAHANGNIKTGCLKAGVDEFLTKPVDNNHILEIINNCKNATCSC